MCGTRPRPQLDGTRGTQNRGATPPPFIRVWESLRKKPQESSCGTFASANAAKRVMAEQQAKQPGVDRAALWR
jgi:hypothetical protein